MSCNAGVCTATEQKAVLNIADLQTMLASGDVAVKTGSAALNIEIAAPLTWSSTSRLTLDAQQSIIVKKSVTVAGTGALTIVINDGGKNGEFATALGQGSVHFADPASSLTIDGNGYTLVGDIKTFAADVAGNPSGFYALANDFDASADGRYTAPPVATLFTGVFEGLGNAVQNLTITTKARQSGFFSNLGGSARDLRLENENLVGGRQEVGGLTGDNTGVISHVEVTGSVEGQADAGRGCVGGLAGSTGGTIAGSDSRANVESSFGTSGGLVCVNYGQIVDSFATGNVEGFEAGGLIGLQVSGGVNRSFATGAVDSPVVNGSSSVGGLIGHIGIYGGDSVEDCYATGSVSIPSGEGGGLIGFVQAFDHSPVSIAGAFATGAVSRSGYAELGGVIGRDLVKKNTALYWDLDTTGINNPHRGAGHPHDDPHLTGLTDAELKAGLPQGFDPAVWGQNAKINNSYPYLLANPPPK